MYPILFTIGDWSISSFGLFLSLALLMAAFVVWRLCLVYDYDKEQTLDLVMLTFFGSFFGARIYYIIFHWGLFADTSIHLSRMFHLYLYPGLSFWGAFVGGILTLFFFSKRLRLNLWQILDIGIVGFFIALALGSIGCLLNSCQYGFILDSPISISQVGLVGNRFPLQVIEALLYLIVFIYLWKISLKFHFTGKIFSLGIIYFSIIKFVLEFFRGDQFQLVTVISLGHLFAIATFIYGIWSYYKTSKKSFIGDLNHFQKVLFNSKIRQNAISNILKRWYNTRVHFRYQLSQKHKGFLKRINVKSNPPEI